MPKDNRRGRRVKSVVKAFGGGKKAQKATSKGVTAVRKGIKAVGGKKAARKGAVRAGAGALKNLGKTTCS